jgi:hypothetical protein
MHPTDKAARIAGAIYLSMVLTGPLTLIYLPDKLIVSGNAVATAENMLAHENLYRLWIIGDMWTHVIFICLGVSLYCLLRCVSKPWAVAMLGFVLVSAAVGFANILNSIAAFILFRGAEFLNVIEQAQRDALGMLFVRLHSQGNFINEAFWGLWLFPFGLLVFRSGFLPRWIGIWLMVNCVAWLVLMPIALFALSYYDAAFRFAQPMLFGELAIMLWLLIKGAKMPKTPLAVPLSA